ncbi:MULTISPECIES: hypothetical protein [Pseudanabaena]|uniref:Uncharacterized protein n=2 Tax=Pseudanabaena TaxID=1152 RepID=L8N862_9CYAN|nr:MULTISPECIES: hypothetical protein [Pseudanabaena]ELS34428.1 hypothetical protein Pse7429DRAFT_0515 [Pseudanabaena biceps PCC 7429]MDG3493389.1 hypothetical protein [Pseudanabaena catenata USMAC16]
MQDKQKVTQKVTFYLPERLHQQLKIRSAIDGDSMSDLAEKAISFYLAHADIVDSSGVGHTHQTYSCPSCSQTVVIRNGELLAIGGSRNQPSPVTVSKADSQDEELVSIG